MFEAQACKSSQPYQSIYEHGEQPEIQSVLVSVRRKENRRALKNACGTEENHHTTLLMYGLSQESNQGNVGKMQALYALAKHSTHV